MKKIGFICLVFLCCLPIYAEETKYQNIITDETTIEEDFQVLGMDIKEYYQTKYNYSKWYVVGMSEAYDMPTYDIQTYFYIYNPMKLESFTQEIEIDGEWCESKLESITLEYKLSNNKSFMNTEILDTNYEHHLLKVKGFKYPFCEAAKIEILSIQNLNTYMPGIVSESGFKATTNHSKLNGLSVELSFNSTLIIDEYEAVDVKLQKEYDSLINELIGVFRDFFKDLVDQTSTDHHLIFYNFNFPDHIQYDSVEYAKFSYDSTIRNYVIQNGIVNNGLTTTTKLIKEYEPGTYTFKADKYSKELEFQTFVLGNRVLQGEFGSLKFNEEEKNKFNYDCSILLDSAICWSNKMNMAGTAYQYRTKELENIEMLELWYKKAGIVYRCQVVTNPTDPTPVNPKPADPWYVKLWKFFIKIGEFLFKVIGKTSNEVGYGLTGIGTCVLGIACGIPFIIKRIIKLVFLPGKIVAKIFGG